MSVLITGANRGVGMALADVFRADGKHVIGTARSLGDGLLPLDVADPKSVAALARQLQDRTVDLLICNAGVYLDKRHNIDDGYPPAMWAETFAINVTGVFLCVQEFLPHLRRSNAPKIAILSSQMASDERAGGGALIYRASKAAALNLGRNLAVDLKGDGIAVGIYHPGWVQTEMGGSSASITPEVSASGLAARFDALSLATTGCFETWDGRQHPF